ncbi:MAG: 8-amino-7-oxononanoate synthase [Halofilum sp. (in: g-proteobacteria)]|nr:8-amino-7-oxononanoate synthase [Halofilum sp. (in: g-proteobacteria)]
MRDLKPALEQRRAERLYRARRIAESAQGPEMVMDGHHVLGFCSNDYLGLAADPRLAEAMAEGAHRWGTGSGAAHLVNGHSEPHHALEEELAAFTGRERALLFSTGYMANLGVGSALLERGDAVFEDRLNHASLIDAGLRPRVDFHRYRHTDTADLDKRLQKSSAEEKLVLTDGVFSMDGDVAPLVGLADACRMRSARLVVDDAHGLGVIGPGGRGSCADAGLTSAHVPVLVGTLGKAFGTFGAFVAGDEDLVETLIQKARSYVYTTALPPAVAEATRTSLHIVEAADDRRVHLRSLVKRFREGAKRLGLTLMDSNTPIQPILVGDAGTALAMSDALLREGILVTAIRPPTVPPNTARLRVTFSASHTTGHVDRLLETLGRLHDIERN